MSALGLTELVDVGCVIVSELVYGFGASDWQRLPVAWTGNAVLYPRPIGPLLVASVSTKFTSLGS